MSEEAALTLWDQPGPTVRLRHVVFTTSGVQHFYDGSAPVRDGVVELPVAKLDWLRTAWTDGYRINDETGKPVDSVEALADSILNPEPEPEPAPAKRGKRTRQE